MEDNTLLEIFAFEASQMLEQTQSLLLMAENTQSISQNATDELFRLVHTIKGSASMLSYDNIVSVAHAMEELLYRPDINLLLAANEFIKNEIDKVAVGRFPNGDASEVLEQIHNYISKIAVDNLSIDAPSDILSSNVTLESKSNVPSYMAKVFFQEKSQMENMRAFQLIHRLSKIAEITATEPNDLSQDETSKVIATSGVVVYFSTARPKAEIEQEISRTMLVKSFELIEVSEVKTDKLISVSIQHLDRILQLSNAIITAVTDGNNNVIKIAANELQEVVKEACTVPMSVVFNSMKRMVQSISKRIGKEVSILSKGEGLNVEKKIADSVGVAFTHLIRNAMDHGIESSQERQKAGKSICAKITIEAVHDGTNYIFSVTDDGRGIDSTKILKRTMQKNITNKNITNEKILNLITLPGFSCKDEVSELSGRGMGMDIVKRCASRLGGNVSFESTIGVGTTMQLTIPVPEPESKLLTSFVIDNVECEIIV